ncbi:MAG: DMT family transporter [Bacillus subtilis]|nr:DMT family transporter [Bacillus subtilis]
MFWGVSFISIEALVIGHYIDSVTLGFFRYVFAVIFVLIVAVVSKMSFKITKRDFVTFFLAGFMGIFMYSIFENSSMLYISSETASILVSLTPMAAVLGNRLVYKEKIGAVSILLILISIAGVAMVVFHNGLDLGGLENAWIGYLFMVLSIVFWTVYTLITKKAGMKYNSLKITTIQSIVALFTFLPTLIFRPFPDFMSFGSTEWFHLIFLGVICSGVCYYLYIFSVDALGVTLPNVFINFVPLFTVLTNILVFGETIDVWTIVGGLVIILSMTLLTIRTIRTTTEKP